MSREKGFGLLVVLAIALAGCTMAGEPPRPLEPALAPPAFPATASLSVHYVNVGQGDGVVWQLPGGQFVVYDCGPPAASAALNPVVAHLRGLGLQPGATLHALIASHGHLDHIGGCEEVLQEYRVLHLYEAWYDGADAPRSYTRFRDQLKAEGGIVHVLAETPALENEVTFRAGDVVALPETATAAGVRAEVLWPPAFQANRWDRIAESSVAVRLSFGDVAFCFQGDVETVQEALMAQRIAGRDCEVYLVGHHGSRYASSADWLAAIDSELAVVSFGKNSYGHPSSEALCRVQQAGSAVYATHRTGTVTVETDGSQVSATTGLPESKDYCLPAASYWSP